MLINNGIGVVNLTGKCAAWYNWYIVCRAGRTNLKTQLKAKLLIDAIESARQGLYLEATTMFRQSGVLPGEQVSDTDNLAYAFYRCALMHQSTLNESCAIRHLETSLKFPRLPQPLRMLIQQRLTLIRKGLNAKTREFDKAIEGQFEKTSSEIDVRGEFLKRYSLNQANRN